jgi:hypothetical protein
VRQFAGEDVGELCAEWRQRTQRQPRSLGAGFDTEKGRGGDGSNTRTISALL